MKVFWTKLQDALKLDLEAVDDGTKILAARAKAAGATEKEILNINIKGGQERLDVLRKTDAELLREQDLYSIATTTKESDFKRKFRKLQRI
jgi:hypothetical protein